MSTSLLKDNHPQDRFGPESCRIANAFDSAIAVIPACCPLRQQYAGLPTVAVSSGQAAVSCITALTLSILNCPSGHSTVTVRFREPKDAGQTISASNRASGVPSRACRARRFSQRG